MNRDEDKERRGDSKVRMKKKSDLRGRAAERKGSKNTEETAKRVTALSDRSKCLL